MHEEEEHKDISMVDDFNDNTNKLNEFFMNDLKIIIERKISDSNLNLDGKLEEIFASWDLDNDGLLSYDTDIKKTLGVDESFGTRSIFRILDANHDGTVDIRDFKETIDILHGTNINDKLRIFFRFFGASNDSDSLTLAQIKSAVKVRGNSLYEMLDFMNKGKIIDNKRLTIQDLHDIFTASESGEKAIVSFCQALSTILSRPLLQQRQVTNVATIATKQTVPILSGLFSKFGAPIAAQFIFWVANFVLSFSLGSSIWVCIAKGFGLNLYVITIALFLTMSRSMNEYVYGMRALQRLIDMQSNIELHSFLGFSIVFHSIGHSIAQIVNLTISKGFNYTVYAPALMSGSSWYKSTSGDGITGYLLLFIVLIIAITSIMRRINSFMYNIFRRCHYLYLPWVLLIIIHVPSLWSVTLAGIGLFLLDALYKFVMCTCWATLRRSRNKGHVSYISIKRQPFQPYPVPGAYYRLMIPAVSPIEWHPFSLASSCASNHLTFMIDSVGDWTRAVHKLIEDPKRRDEATVYVQGPFIGTAHIAVEDLDDGRPVMIIASGVGITPFLSVMATKVTDQEANESSRRIFAALFDEQLSFVSIGPYMCQIYYLFTISNQAKTPRVRRSFKTMINSVSHVTNLAPRSPSREHSAENIADMRTQVSDRSPLDPIHPASRSSLHLIWAIRDCADLLFYIEYVHHLVESQNRLSKMIVFIDVYLTGLGSSCDPAFLISQTLFYVLVGQKTGKYLRVHYGRPDIPSCIKDVSPGAVYYCGGSVLKDITANACRDAKVPFFPESFDFSGRVGLWFQRQWQQTFPDKKNGQKDKGLKKKSSFIDI